MPAYLNNSTIEVIKPRRFTVLGQGTSAANGQQVIFSDSNSISVANAVLTFNVPYECILSLTIFQSNSSFNISIDGVAVIAQATGSSTPIYLKKGSVLSFALVGATNAAGYIASAEEIL